MDFQVEEKGPVLRRVAGRIAGEALDAEERKAYAKLRTTSKLKGFRQGKVPRAVLERMFGRQVRMDSMQTLVQRAMLTIVDDIPGLIHVSPWRVVDERLEDGGFRFEVDVEIKPEVELSDYKGLEVEASSSSVDDAVVEAELERLRAEQGTLEDVTDRDVCQSGDTVRIDYEAEGEGAAEQLRNSGQVVELGSGTALEGLEAGLEGARVDEERRIELTLPESFQGLPELAGQTVVLKVTPRSIQRKVLPELDDAFAKQTGQAETLAELTEKTRARLEGEAAARRKTEIERGVLDRLRERFPFELPHGYIESRTEERIRDQVRYFVQQGLPEELALQVFQGSRDGLRLEVMRQVQDEVLLAAVARQEGLEATEEDREAHLVQRAEQTRTPVARVRRLYATPEMRDLLDTQIRLDKALALLVEHAQVSERASGADDGGEATEA